MAENVVHFRGTRQQLHSLISTLPRILSGHVSDPTGLTRGLQLRIGVQALSLIKEAFVAKARGGSDEAGDSWPPLSKKYVAYHRRHPGLASKRAQAKAEGRPGRPLLTKQQNERWKSIYARTLHALTPNLLQGPGREEKSHAAAHAWMVLKAEGGKTIFGEYADAPTETLRDTGTLLNSLSPGVDGPSGHPNQIFNVSPGSIIVGSNRKGAAFHHRGKRRLWPRVETWPARWWSLIMDQLRDGAAQVLVNILRG